MNSRHPALLWTESEFQSNVVRVAKSLGFGLVYHTHDSRRSAAGFPDLVLVHPARGRVLFVELKAQHGRVSAEQEQWINGLRTAGLFAEVWRPSDYVGGRIMDILRGVPVAGAR